MGVRIFETTAECDAGGRAGLFCSVTNTPLAVPMFEDADTAEAFLAFASDCGVRDLRCELRSIGASGLERLLSNFRADRAAARAGVDPEPVKLDERCEIAGDRILDEIERRAERSR